VAPLGGTSRPVLLYLFVFPLAENMSWVSGAVGSGIEIDDGEVEDAVGTRGPETADQEITTLFRVSWQSGGRGRGGWDGINSSCRATGVD
jgi:hypothetical protein